jgi:transcriptional regulator with XRE-family HTH domain
MVSGGVDMVHYGDRIKQIRKARGMSQADLADPLGLTVQRISQIEREKSPGIKIDQWRVIAETLRVSFGALLGDDSDNLSLSA